MEQLLHYIKCAAALAGGVLGVLLGSVDGLLIALIAFMAIDYLTGLIVGVVRKNLSSAVGFVGLAKKVLILLLVIVANLLDVHVLQGGSAARGLVIAFYLANEGLSIVENAGKLGVPIPQKLVALFAQLKADGDTKN